MVKFIELHDTKILIIFLQNIKLLQLLHILELQLVSVYNKVYDSALTVIVQQTENIDSMIIIEFNENKTYFYTYRKRLYESNQINMRLLQIDIAYQAELSDKKIYPPITEDSKKLNLSVLYLNQKIQILISYKSLVSEIQDYQSVIYKIENGVIHLTNENEYIGYIVDANRKILTFMEEYEIEYGYLIINLIKCGKVTLDNKFLFGQSFEVQFSIIRGLFQKINDSSNKQYQCQVEVHGQLFTDEQRSYVKGKQLAIRQYPLGVTINNLFSQTKVVATGIRHEENRDILQLIAIE